MTQVLPLFPLPDHVLLPGAPVPFRIFEPRYRALVRDLEAQPDGMRWLAMPRLLAAGNPGDPPPFAEVAAAARVLDIQDLPHGQYLIVIQGLVRMRLEEVPSPGPYRMARGTAMPEAMGDREAAERAASAVVESIRSIGGRAGGDVRELDALLAEQDPVAMADHLAAVALTDPDHRQHYLESCVVAKRLAWFARLLGAQRGPGAGGRWDFSTN